MGFGAKSALHYCTARTLEDPKRSGPNKFEEKFPKRKKKYYPLHVKRRSAHSPCPPLGSLSSSSLIPSPATQRHRRRRRQFLSPSWASAFSLGFDLQCVLLLATGTPFSITHRPLLRFIGRAPPIPSTLSSLFGRDGSSADSPGQIFAGATLDCLRAVDAHLV